MNIIRQRLKLALGSALLAAFPSIAAADHDVAVTVAAVTESPQAGRDILYRLFVYSYGPGPAVQLTLTVGVPAGASFVWAPPYCTPAAGIVTCNLGNPGPPSGNNVYNIAAIVFMAFRPAAAGPVTVTATAAATGVDVNPANDSGSLTVTAAPSAAGVPVPRYRLYNTISREHHFTADANEYNVLSALGPAWVPEGVAGRVLDNPGSHNGVAAVPLYRLFNRYTGQHHWTAFPKENYELSIPPVYDWIRIGVDGFVLPTQAPGTVPLLRMRYPYIASMHHWTVDPNEHATLTTNFGWVAEGVTGFVIP